jgi:hypothetical protein
MKSRCSGPIQFMRLKRLTSTEAAITSMLKQRRDNQESFQVIDALLVTKHGHFGIAQPFQCGIANVGDRLLMNEWEVFGYRLGLPIHCGQDH